MKVEDELTIYGEPTLWNGETVTKMRKKFGLTRQIFAEMVNFSLRKMATYEKTATLPANVQRPITETLQLVQALGELVGDEAQLKDWLREPNAVFGGDTPLAVIKAGRSDLIWQVIYEVRFGAFA